MSLEYSPPNIGVKQIQLLGGVQKFGKSIHRSQSGDIGAS